MTDRATADDARQAREAAKGCAADVAQKIADGCTTAAGLIDRATSDSDPAARAAHLADARQLAAMAGFAAGNLLKLQEPTGRAGDFIVAKGRRDALALLDAAAASTDRAERDRLLEEAEAITRSIDRIEDFAEPPSEDWLTSDNIVDACTTSDGTAVVVARLAKAAEDGSLARALLGIGDADADALARIVARTQS